MATAPISEAARVTWELQKDDDAELYQYSCATYQRDSADWGDLMSAAETWWVDEIGGLTARSHLVGVRYSEWGTGGGFTGFHQKASIVVSHGGSSGAMLPPQCAVVVSLLNTIDVSTNLKSRRGRIYYGMVPTGSVTTDGKLSSTAHDGVEDAFVALVAALEAVPGSSTSHAAVLDGIAIASPTTSLLLQANKLGVGLGIDTQRRRRRKVQEAIVYVDASV